MSVFLFNLVLIFAAPAAPKGEAAGGGFLEFYNHYLNYPGFEAWRFLNLTIFVAILFYLLKKPLTEAFRAKRETIRAELIKAEAEKQAALAQLTATEAKLANLDAETQTVRSRAAQEAEAEKTRISEQTEFEINKLREQANSEIERKNQQARTDLRKFSAEESIRLAEEKIKREINADKDAQIVKANIQAIGGLN
ncbi:MAG: ATP synthase F0 subunit B [Pyrinomonadaceae bacterium]|nr:ATP synthase F0 subunit B [Pyrinomonadaceae bacterium]